MDCEKLEFESIRKFCNIQPIEENKDLCKSIFEYFKQFCIKRRYDINRRFAQFLLHFPVFLWWGAKCLGGTA